MHPNKRYIAILFCLFLSVSSASNAATPTETKDWTFLVFLNGHNNLDSYGTMNMKQMEKVGSTNSVNVVVQWASSSASTTRRILVKKSNNPNAVTSPVVEDMPRVDMGNYKNLVEFVKWGVKNYPAKHYFINVWNHGGGWHRDRKNPTRNISNDDFSGNSISTVELAKAMEESAKFIGHKVDIYGSDACLMGMIEVAYEMKDSVEYFIGSQETEPGAGWPYDTFLDRWVKNPSMTGASVGQTLDEAYIASSSSTAMTLSTVDLKNVDLVVEDIKSLSLSTEKLPATERTLLKKAWDDAQRFYYSDYTDLGDAIRLGQSLSLQSLNSQLFTALASSLTGYLVDNHTSASYKKATGVSIWLPNSQYTYERYASRYQELKFEKDTRWSKTLEWLLKD